MGARTGGEVNGYDEWAGDACRRLQRRGGASSKQPETSCQRRVRSRRCAVSAGACAPAPAGALHAWAPPATRGRWVALATAQAPTQERTPQPQPLLVLNSSKRKRMPRWLTACKRVFQARGVTAGGALTLWVGSGAGGG